MIKTSPISEKRMTANWQIPRANKKRSSPKSKSTRVRYRNCAIIVIVLGDPTDRCKKSRKK
jgi:hypothetical protein